MTTQFKNFYQHWLQKADNYQNNELKDYFDKFFTLFVIFNFLYMEIWNIRCNNGLLKKKNFNDRKAATNHVIEYVGARFYISQLLIENEYRNNFSALTTIKDEFYIVLDWGKPQLFKDLDLWESLEETNINKKATAVLALFYNIRCNLFHGHKDFEEEQKKLLAPINVLLRKTIEIVYNKLNLTAL